MLMKNFNPNLWLNVRVYVSVLWNGTHPLLFVCCSCYDVIIMRQNVKADCC